MSFTQEQLETFGKAIEDNYNSWSVAHNSSYNKGGVKVSFEEGKKYIRVVRSDPTRSVHSFVDKETGDVYKAAGWKAPAKNFVRGNVKELTDRIVYWTGAY